MEIDLAFLYGAGRAFAIVGALLTFAWALRSMRRESAEQLALLQQLTAAQIKTRSEIHALTEKVGALATLVAAIPARVEPPAETPRATPRREPTLVRSYETARRLARSGATVEEIVATCGVACSEARLLQRLHASST